MRRPVILAALVALCVRALVVSKLPAAAIWEGANYAELAGHLASGHGYVRWASAAGGFAPTAFLPVGYAALLALFTPAFGSPAAAARVVNLLAAAVAAASAAVLGFRVAHTRGGYVAGLAYALAPGSALSAAATLSETVSAALLASAVAAAVVPVAAVRARVGWSACAGLLLGFGALVRPHVLLAAPFVGGLPPATRAVRLAAAMACIGAALLWVLPWSVRNCVSIGGCALVSTNSGENLLAGTLPPDRAAREATVLRECHGASNEPARDRCMTRAAAARIVHAPFVWARLALFKLFRTFAFEWAPVAYLRAAIPGAFAGPAAFRAAVVCSIWWWLLGAAAVVGGARAARSGGRALALVRIIALNGVLFAATHAVFLADDRYHQPLVPLLAALAAGLALPARPQPEPEFVWAG